MKRKHKKLLIRVIASGVLFCGCAVIDKLIELSVLPILLLYLVPYLVAGYDVILKALFNVRSGHFFDENFLMCIATVGAFIIGEYPEAVFVMLFYKTGELFQSLAVGKSRRSIAALMDIRPEEARVIREGEEVLCDPEDVMIGETVVVRAGDKIPIDGIVTDGVSELNCMALTGESVPRYVETGMKVNGGCINLSGVLKIEVTSRYEDSTVAKILELVENASSVKSKTDRLITRFARYYTPIVVVLALLLFLIPSIITGQFSEWLGKALVFLVISCPCALVISVPLSYFGGLGAASRKGILIKGACYLESLAKCKTVVFDKTGTLTKGAFTVCGEACYVDRELLYSVANALESISSHPIALAVSKATTSCSGKIVFDSITEKAGMGVVASVGEKKYFSGNIRLLKEFSLERYAVKSENTVVYVGEADSLYGYFEVSDAPKETSAEAVRHLKRLGVSKTVMLSGDKNECARRVSEELGIDHYVGELLPEGKVRELERILHGKSEGDVVAYVGDGINDAPVLSRADIGISMGALGSDAAIEAADVVLMDDDPIRIADGLRLARATRRIVIQNIVFALGIKIGFMVLGAFDIAGLWLAVFADVGVSVIAILNAMRTLKLK